MRRVEREILLQRLAVCLARACQIVLLLEQRPDGVLEERLGIVEEHEVLRVARAHFRERRSELRDGAVQLTGHAEDPTAFDAKSRLELRRLCGGRVQTQGLIETSVTVRDPAAELGPCSLEPALHLEIDLRSTGVASRPSHLTLRLVNDVRREQSAIESTIQQRVEIERTQVQRVECPELLGVASSPT